MDKEEAKRMLRQWGQAMEQFQWKEEELERAEAFYKMQRKLWTGEMAESLKLEQIEKDYQKERGRLRIEMVEILREKAAMDEMIKRLTIDEGIFLQMRFEKGYGFDYIAMKMHLSRATLFRMQDRILGKVMRWKENESGKDCVEML